MHTFVRSDSKLYTKYDTYVLHDKNARSNRSPHFSLFLSDSFFLEIAGKTTQEDA